MKRLKRTYKHSQKLYWKKEFAYVNVLFPKNAKIKNCKKEKKYNLAERSFDLRTSGLWAQHASTAPLCCSYNQCSWKFDRISYTVAVCAPADAISLWPEMSFLITNYYATVCSSLLIAYSMRKFIENVKKLTYIHKIALCN